MARIAGQGDDLVSADRLRKGQLVVVRAGEIIPADGEIMQGAATVDESAITGESAPVVREAGSPVLFWLAVAAMDALTLAAAALAGAAWFVGAALFLTLLLGILTVTHAAPWGGESEAYRRAFTGSLSGPIRRPSILM